MVFPFFYAPQKVGPCGGDGGEEKSMEVEKNDFIRMMRIHIYVEGDNEAIKALTVEFERNGRRESTKLWSDKVWKKQKHRPADKIIDLEQPEEYIRVVCGRMGPYKNKTVLKSLKITTNKRTWGPYGAAPTRLDKHFRLPAFGGQVVGFFGRCSECVDAIGVYVQETSHCFKAFIEILRFVSLLLGSLTGLSFLKSLRGN